MKRNCVYNYITKNQPKKDIVVYQYKNPVEYIIRSKGGGCYETFNNYTKEDVNDNNLLDLIWCKSNILCDYDQDVIFLQVNFGR